MVFKTLTNSQRCGRNPWQTTLGLSPTLEWMVASPPAFHTFEEIPSIKDTLPPHLVSSADSTENKLNQ